MASPQSTLDGLEARWGRWWEHDGTYRFSELRRRVAGVSEKMLSQTLRLLEEDGFVLRRDFGEVPPRVEYELTPMGKELARHIAALGKWISDNTTKVLAAREEHQRAAKRGRPGPASPRAS